MEAGFNLIVRPKTLEDGIKAVLGLRRIKAMTDASESQIVDVLTEDIGKQFTDSLMKEFNTKEHLDEVSEYLPKNANIDYAWSVCSMIAKDKNRFWLESRSGELSAGEVCPDHITIYARSKDHGEFYDRIEMDFDARDAAPFKVAIFSRAFTNAGFLVDECKTWDDLQDEEDWD